MRSYIKLPPVKPMPDSKLRTRQFTDYMWINYVNHIILRYYKEVDTNEIKLIIKTELSKQQAKIEDKIKEHIYSWIKKDKRIGLWEFILTLESKSDSFKGFYDMKFSHSQWKKYFVFEAKNLGKIKTTKSYTLINEYVYVNTKDRKDGGMYRFMTKKYATKINFGGMIGFVVGEVKGNIIKDLTDKIQSVYRGKINGKLIDMKIELSSIEENENTFTTFHLRNGEKFNLYHILMYFN
ncbi:MAG TPA: hypothetical protein ENI76_08990 [Ignavibacteria bacterium]|nr:hypothetical protein [Ignavibacteria bacterium]